MNNLTQDENNIIKELEKCLIPHNLPIITQERFDLIIDELIKDDII